MNVIIKKSDSIVMVIMDTTVSLYRSRSDVTGHSLRLNILEGSKSYPVMETGDGISWLFKEHNIIINLDDNNIVTSIDRQPDGMIINSLNIEESSILL